MMCIRSVFLVGIEVGGARVVELCCGCCVVWCYVVLYGLFYVCVVFVIFGLLDHVM